MAKTYKFVFTPLSFFSDLFSSDTVFGALCWAMRYGYGEEKLEQMLKQFEAKPPFLVSSFLPLDYMPKPVLPLQYTKEEVLHKKERIQQFSDFKKKKKLRWAPISLFVKYQKNFNHELFIEEIEYDNSVTVEPSNFDITRNAISRFSGTVLEGMLFTDTYKYIDLHKLQLVVYVKVFDGQYDELIKELFSAAAQMGLGSNTSIGKGLFTVTQDALNQNEEKMFMFTGNCFTTLSLTAGSNLKAISYQTFTKYAKVGGEFSQIGINGKLLFNKKPIVFYKEGSTFVNNGNSLYGMMIKNIHPDTRIMQYGYAFPVYFNFHVDNENDYNNSSKGVNR
ncbi:MAG: type III-A CRISPR-associated RAMP protein Csm4 [Spirochaetota bacterium]